MTISEAVKRLSEEMGEKIDKNFVYFYDRQKIFSFARNFDNEYRFVSEEDLPIIKKVWILNRMNIPLRMIRSYLRNGKEGKQYVKKRKDELKRLMKKGFLV